jgi:hypothetical protein
MLNYQEILEQRRRRIEKAQKALDLLADPDIAQQLANDPELRDAFLKLISGNGQHASPTTAPRATARTTRITPPEGSQLRAVLDSAAQQSGDFTPKGLAEQMQSNRYHFNAEYPQIAVNSALKQLETRGWIRLVRQGSGRAPSKFRYIREEEV